MGDGDALNIGGNKLCDTAVIGGVYKCQRSARHGGHKINDLSNLRAGTE
jgi:hypothetical protein